ncbi:phosphotransferase family protein [Novosphingobium sp. BL-52-GroH]|uniref:phosphotransferase family protein n=1 Tax=Novosphingobium sp. BL-52-GroH TaxID=3349877 RepID=UPI003850748B
MASSVISYERDLDEQDPFLAAMLDRRQERLRRGAYLPLSTDAITHRLAKLIAHGGVHDAHAENVRRMAGGASKEQFVFDLVGDHDGSREKLVLRMDPTDGVLETNRERECEIIDAMKGIVPVPEVRFRDLHGDHLGGVGMVTTFVSGVTKPSDSASGVTGLGTGFSEAWRERLTPQFIEVLRKIHAVDFRSVDLPHFGIPDKDPRQAALWRVNLWSRVWREDSQVHLPIFALTESWLRANLPTCDDVVLLHGDFRTGNYLFDEGTGEITCVLDWESAHIGDHHEDLAWSLVRIFGARASDGTYLCSSLMSVDELVDRYEQATGRTVNRTTLRFYRVLQAWGTLAMAAATGLRAAAAHHNHQDVLLTWLSMVTPSLIDELTDVLLEESVL